MSLVYKFKARHTFKSRGMAMLGLLATTAMVLSSCADAVGPAARNISIPAPKSAEERKAALNEGGDPIVYLPLGEDVLMPQSEKSSPLPDTVVGPYELRGETLAGALQLVLDGVDIPVAFEATDSLTQTITVTNLKGPIGQVVGEVCSLANMYCAFQNGVLVVKDRQIFTVSIPPIVATADVAALLNNIAGAVGNITGETPITDASTRTIVYRASQRTAEMAARYFQRLRSNTAMVIYETYIWEVSLDSGNTTGIKWDGLANMGRFKYGINLKGAADTNVGSPISIGLPTTGEVDFTTGDVLEFISSYGAVKTISQPQITVLSGSAATLRIADTQNYVASISRTTTDGGNTTVSTTTDSVDTGFTLNIGSNWDNSTVYGNIDILLQEVKQIDTFDDNPDAVVQLPQTSERELKTQVRIRPGDLLLIAGLVKQSDNYKKEGLGFADPLIPTSRSTLAANTELVFLLRPRVIVFTSKDINSPRKGSVALPDSSFTQPMSNEASAVSSHPVAPITLADTVVEDDAPMPPIAKESIVAPAPATTPLVSAKEKLVVNADEPASASIEIQPLSSVVPVAKQGVATDNPSVIVDYDVLGH